MRPVVGRGMRDYYEARARKYDDWWLGTGQFATRERPGWAEEVEAMVAIAAQRLPGGRVVRGEAVPLPFGDGAFDRVFTGHFYGHLVTADELAGELGGGEVLHAGRWFVAVRA